MYNEMISEQISSAMKSGDIVRLAVWRSIKSEFVKYQTANANNVLTVDKQMQIISKMVLQRKDSIEQYTNANREDLANAEKAELEILVALLPKEASDDDIRKLIKDIFSVRVEPPTMKDMKNVMTAVKAEYPTVDGAKVSKIFREEFI
jgi:uncharacterized protein YqeY